MGSSQSQQLQEAEYSPMSLPEALAKFSELLAPNWDFYKSTRNAAIELLNLVKENRRDVARTLVVGCVAKRTAITTNRIPGYQTNDDPKVEAVIYLKREEPPFGQILEQFEQQLKRGDRSDDDLSVLSSTSQYFLRVKHQGTIIDIIPATCFEPSEDSSGASSSSSSSSRPCCKSINTIFPTDTQYELTLQRIASTVSTTRNPRAACKKYESALAEYSTLFMKAQSPFTHSVIRLGKFWDANIDFQGNYVNSHATLIEVVAVHAASLSSNSDILRAFEMFLSLMANFSNVKLNVGQLTLPNYLNQAQAIILDPVNPYSNLAEQNPFIVKRFEGAAASTLGKLRQFKQVRRVGQKDVRRMSEIANLIKPLGSSRESVAEYRFEESLFDFRPESDVVRL